MSTPHRVAAITVLAIAIVAAAACSTVPVPPITEGPEPTVPCTPLAALDVPYAEVPGVDPNLLALDVYPPPGACEGNGDGKPVVVWVHGGGWTAGDKANLAAKQQWAAAQGWVLVSVNYRLSPSPRSDDPDRVMHPTHTQDVAAALAWIDDHIGEHGGDSTHLALVGHSAGGHLVSLVSVDQRYLAGAGAPTDLIDCTVALDTEGYDLSVKLDEGEASQAMVRNAFGDDGQMIRGASPLFQIEPGERLPDFLVVTRGAARRQATAAQFADALTHAGGAADLLVASGYSHSDVNRRLGEPGEAVVTPPVDQLLDRCLTTDL